MTPSSYGTQPLFSSTNPSYPALECSPATCFSETKLAGQEPNQYKVQFVDPLHHSQYRTLISRIVTNLPSSPQTTTCDMDLLLSITARAESLLASAESTVWLQAPHEQHYDAWPKRNAMAPLTYPFRAHPQEVDGSFESRTESVWQADIRPYRDRLTLTDG